MAFAFWVLENLRPDALCVDAGAHTGEWLAYFKDAAPAGRHLAFEPLPHLVAKLRSEYPTYRIGEAALAADDGWAEFLHIRNDPAWSGLRLQERYFAEPDVERIKVRTVPLDRVSLDRLDLFKIDVEGAELEVLRGAEATLRRFRPTVFFEHARIHFANYGDTTSALFDLLARVGLQVFSLEQRRLLDDGGLQQAVAAAAARDYDFPSETNFIAAPIDRLRQLELVRT
jgi:FkbM family methyltransferase